MTKSELRLLFTGKRQALTPEEIRSMSEGIARNFFASFDLGSTAFIHCFLPIPSKQEPDTWLLVDQLALSNPKLTIVLPRITPAGEMQSIAYEGRGRLKKNAWGIDEPVGDEIIADERIGMVLVPLLAFDRRGHRVGYGKGFYDRLLSRNKTATRVGISLFEPVDLIADITSSDEPLNHCVTPARVYSLPL